MTRWGQHLVLSLIAGVLFAFSTSNAEAVSFKNCSGDEKTLVRSAHSFVREHLRELKGFDLAKRRGRERRIKRRMDRKIGKLKFNCRSGVICNKPNRIGAAPMGRMGKHIRLCMTNMGGETTSFCQLVEGVAHEFAHVVGINRANFGAHGRNRNDRVYRFGFFAEHLCESETDTFRRPAIRTGGDRVRLDWCRTWGRDCGAPAATAFCRANGFSEAEFFQKAENVGRRVPTAVIESGRRCTASHCDGFKRIVCVN